MTCEACWRNPVQAARTTTHTTRRDLLCVPCAQQNSPTRVDLFPPLGIYKLTLRNTTMGKHRNPAPAHADPRPPPGLAP
ncbi:hypothetical protein ACFVHW_38650 [Streptomyces sp. NPDC127110]|uniref:hypothetical protein n=1 Tax=Streptomyces sp. NPDC127110 TaxID=3345362 RepID=UPI0036295B0D